MRENQVRAGPSGQCYHAWCLMVVSTLLALQSCVAFAYAQSAPFPQCHFKELHLRELVIRASDRLHPMDTPHEPATTAANTHTAAMKTKLVTPVMSLTTRNVLLAQIRQQDSMP